MKSDQDTQPVAVSDAPEKLLTTKEVATWLGIQPCTLEKARSTRIGDFPPFVRLGRAIRYRRGAVETWLREFSFKNDGSPLN